MQCVDEVSCLNQTQKKTSLENVPMWKRNCGKFEFSLALRGAGINGFIKRDGDGEGFVHTGRCMRRLKWDSWQVSQPMVVQI